MRRLMLLLAMLLIAAPLAAQTATNPCSVPTRTTSADKKSYTTTQKCLVAVDTVRVTKTDTVVKTVTVVRVDTVRVPVQPPTTPDTTTPPVVQPPPTSAATPNRPASFTKTVADFGFDVAVPSGCGNERTVSAAPLWSVIYDCGDNGASNWTRTTVDGRTVWQMRQAAGSWTDGHGTGNVGLPLANVKAAYVSVWVKWDAQYESHPISTKFLEFEGAGNCLGQYRHDNNFLRSACEAIQQAYEPQNGAEPTRGVWHQIEWLMQAGSPGTAKIWLDGQLRTSYTNLPVVGPFSAFKIVGHLGGGGMTKTRDSFYWLDRVVVATP